MSKHRQFSWKLNTTLRCFHCKLTFRTLLTETCTRGLVLAGLMHINHINYIGKAGETAANMLYSCEGCTFTCTTPTKVRVTKLGQASPQETLALTLQLQLEQRCMLAPADCHIAMAKLPSIVHPQLLTTCSSICMAAHACAMAFLPG